MNPSFFEWNAFKLNYFSPLLKQGDLRKHAGTLVVHSTCKNIDNILYKHTYRNTSLANYR